MSAFTAHVFSITCTLFLGYSPALAESKTAYDGATALEHAGRVTALGPRPPGSAAHRKMQEIIRSHLGRLGWEVADDAFTAQTPAGPLPMRSIIGKRRGQPGGQVVVLSGHYDTKIMPGIRFVGANDAGSSTAFLMEMARALSGRTLKNDVWLVWLDGEEAVAEWTESDSLYGSRHLAAKWAADGTVRRIKAVINVDMIGDRDLNIVDEQYGTAWLRRLVWNTAARLGYAKQFTREQGWIGDDHLPFLERGVAAIDLIDFSYGPQNSFWHTEHDTVDKLSTKSFQAVGDVLLAVIAKLEEK